MHQIDAMRVFVKVAELGSFVRASEALNVPRSSVSLAVQQLEESLDTQLLHRTTRRVALSQDGRLCFERCIDLLADFDELTSSFHHHPRSLNGRIRVGMPSGLAERLFADALPAFLRAHPQLEVELHGSEQRVDLVGGGFDCVVRVGDVVDESLLARRVGRMAFVSVASAEYVKRHGAPRTPAELGEHRVVHFVSSVGGQPDPFELTDEYGTHVRQLEGTLTVSSGAAYLAACRAGLGMAQIPRLVANDYLHTGELVEILPDHPPESMPVAILYVRRRHLARRVRVFMDWLAETLAPLLDPP